jgi:hypothetical protein
LVTLCNGKQVVVDNEGRKLYDMPNVVDAHVAPNREGTRFIVHERDSSLIGQFTDQTDRKRLKCFARLMAKNFLNITGDRSRETALMTAGWRYQTMAP